jgi:hypothetical protein
VLGNFKVGTTRRIESEQDASDKDVDTILTRDFVTAAADIRSGLLAEDVANGCKAIYTGGDLNSRDVSEVQAMLQIVDGCDQFGWSRDC